MLTRGTDMDVSAVRWAIDSVGLDFGTGLTMLHMLCY